ncbi:hypothetical protein ACKWTF_013383 [Chironomus riparius]
MEIDDFFGIVYKLDSVEGGDRYCDYMGIGIGKQGGIYNKHQFIMLKPSCCGFDYNLMEQKGCNRYQNSYRTRQNYRELTLHNGICRSSLEIVGNRIIHDQKGRRHIVTVREFSEERMRTTITVDSAVTLVKHYVKVARKTVM